jgi:hypothetical protein
LPTQCLLLLFGLAQLLVLHVALLAVPGRAGPQQLLRQQDLLNVRLPVLQQELLCWLLLLLSGGHTPIVPSGTPANAHAALLLSPPLQPLVCGSAS